MFWLLHARPTTFTPAPPLQTRSPLSPPPPLRKTASPQLNTSPSRILQLNRGTAQRPTQSWGQIAGGGRRPRDKQRRRRSCWRWSTWSRRCRGSRLRRSSRWRRTTGSEGSAWSGSFRNGCRRWRRAERMMKRRKMRTSTQCWPLTKWRDDLKQVLHNRRITQKPTFCLWNSIPIFFLLLWWRWWKALLQMSPLTRKEWKNNHDLISPKVTTTPRQVIVSVVFFFLNLHAGSEASQS